MYTRQKSGDFADDELQHLDMKQQEHTSHEWKDAIDADASTSVSQAEASRQLMHRLRLPLPSAGFYLPAAALTTSAMPSGDPDFETHMHLLNTRDYGC